MKSRVKNYRFRGKKRIHQNNTGCRLYQKHINTKKIFKLLKIIK